MRALWIVALVGCGTSEPIDLDTAFNYRVGITWSDFEAPHVVRHGTQILISRTMRLHPRAARTVPRGHPAVRARALPLRPSKIRNGELALGSAL